MKIVAKNLNDQVMDPNKFDRRTHIWDGQGHLVRKNLYTEYVINGDHYLERPVNSGNLWSEGNQPAGRVEKKFNDKGHEVSKQFNFEAAHKVYTPELHGDDKILYQLEQERSRSAELEAELAAIRAEKAVPEARRAEGTTKSPEAPASDLRLSNKKG